MISLGAEYSLRAVRYRAASHDRPQTTEAVARATRVPRAYLAKTLQTLARAEVVTSRRGIGAGFLLRGEAASLSLLQVVEAIDPSRRTRTCPPCRSSHGKDLCPLHRRLDAAIITMERALRESTLEQVLHESPADFWQCPHTTHDNHNEADDAEDDTARD